MSGVTWAGVRECHPSVTILSPVRTSMVALGECRRGREPASTAAAGSHTRRTPGKGQEDARAKLASIACLCLAPRRPFSLPLQLRPEAAAPGGHIVGGRRLPRQSSRRHESPSERRGASRVVGAFTCARKRGAAGSRSSVAEETPYGIPDLSPRPADISSSANTNAAARSAGPVQHFPADRGYAVQAGVPREGAGLDRRF